MSTPVAAARHVGHAISGKLIVKLADGTQQAISAGDSYRIPPDHDAWVEGNEPFAALEIMSAKI